MGKLRSLLGLFFFLFLVLLSTEANAIDYPPCSPVSVHGRLSVNKVSLVNECGYVVQLRGMSSHGLGWFPECYTEDAIKTLAEDWKIDVFRIAVYTHENKGYTTEEWKTKEEYNQYVDELVDLCAKYGIYCIIDWHILNQGSGDPNYTLDDAKEFWDYMSKKHKKDKHVIYEICNEPNGYSVGWNEVKKYANIIIPIIRKNDSKAVVVCGTPTWSQGVDLAANDPLLYDNVMYALHFYAGTHGDFEKQKADYALSKGLPVFVTEFGTSASTGGGGVFAFETDLWIKWMDSRNLSWCNWSFADKNESSAALNEDACSFSRWNDLSESGEYIKDKLSEPSLFYGSCVKCDSCSRFRVGKTESKLDRVLVYYCLSTGEFKFWFSEDSHMKGIRFFDMMGRLVYSFEGSTKSINFAHFSPGSYVVKVEFEEGTSVKRVLKR